MFKPIPISEVLELLARCGDALRGRWHRYTAATNSVQSLLQKSFLSRLENRGFDLPRMVGTGMMEKQTYLGG